MAKVPRESNSTRDPNDNGSQFYICVADCSGLDRTYTVFGEVFRGMEVVDKIVAAARDEFDNPLKPIEMKMTVNQLCATRRSSFARFAQAHVGIGEYSPP
jgi:peptidyl-prolyl cis-trans isomerase B (cyclophilin B)